jgi:ABC-type nickel/cobalt efflux system permease component RcnA
MVWAQLVATTLGVGLGAWLLWRELHATTRGQIREALRRGERAS